MDEDEDEEEEDAGSEAVEEQMIDLMDAMAEYETRNEGRDDDGEM